MSILSIVFTLAVMAFFGWLLLQIPMPQPLKNIIMGILVFVLVIWILQQLGLQIGLPNLTLK